MSIRPGQARGHNRKSTTIKTNTMKLHAVITRRFRLGALLALGHLFSIPPAVAEPVRVACVGDSITWGAAIANRDRDSYPAVLGRLLGDGWEVRNFGRGGATAMNVGGRPYPISTQFQEATAFNPVGGAGGALTLKIPVLFPASLAVVQPIPMYT